MATGPFYDTMPGPLRRDTLNEMWGVWQDAIGSTIKGDAGWSPLIRSVQDGDRVVLEVYDWVGGQGSKPIQTGFLGATGFVATAGLAIDVRGPQGLQGIQGLVGPQGEKGEKGDTGETGPQGIKGDQGPKGDTGLTGDKGDAATISVGTVTTSLPGTPVEIVNSGTTSAAVLNFSIPKGDKGDTGTAATIAVGSVTTGAPGTSVVVTNSGTPEAAVFDFTIPRGADGAGAGDMLKADYDSVGDGVVNAARSTPWAGITDKPLVIAAGTDAASARLVIEAVSTTELTTGLDTKVDKVVGKGLSTEDFTTAEKTKLSGIAEGATVNQTDAFLLDRANHTGSQAISTVIGLQDSLDSKQESLVSGTNLKTINGESILGSGDLVVGGGGSSGPSLVGSTSVEENTTTTYKITNYNSFSVYSVAVSSGTVSISGSTITFKAPAYAPSLVTTLTLTVDGAATNFPISITEKYFDSGSDVDGLSSLVTIQTEWDAGITYASGENVIVRKEPLSFLEFTSLVTGNVGNNPETSPTQWQQVYDNNVSTSGYFGEVLGSKCVVDKGEWNSGATYAVGDMVVVANNTPPLTQADLTAYVSKTASNLNKPPAHNPADWEQRNGLPTGTSLAQTLGIGNTTPEVLINNDSGWLKFVHNGKIKYIAKKPFMHTVSWNDIAEAESVYGNRTVRIGSRLFRVSLLSGAEADPSSWITTSTASDNKGAGGEWNELVYRVHNTVPTDGSTTYQGGKQVGLNWWNFTDADMVVTSASGNGSYTWCKETLAFNTARRVSRGGASLSGFYDGTSSAATASYGWRPCLTLISDEELEGSLYKAEATGIGPSVASLQYDPITDTGYYGGVTSAQFYTGTQISTATGVTGGTLQNDTEGWLKFYWHGQVLFIAKKTYRHNISWGNINSANAIYGVNLGAAGKKTITHSGSSTKYDVKLLKGAIKDPSPASGGGRQWNELLYRVCAGTEAGQIGANWASFAPNTDLGINSSNGSYTWCQEVYQPNTASRVGRGGDSLFAFYNYISSSAPTSYGWRPCLAFTV